VLDSLISYTSIIYCLRISPLMLELPPCGQVQVTKTSRMSAQVSRALIRNEMGLFLLNTFIPYVSFVEP